MVKSRCNALHGTLSSPKMENFLGFAFSVLAATSLATAQITCVSRLESPIPGPIYDGSFGLPFPHDVTGVYNPISTSPGTCPGGYCSMTFDLIVEISAPFGPPLPPLVDVCLGVPTYIPFGCWEFAAIPTQTGLIFGGTGITLTLACGESHEWTIQASGIVLAQLSLYCSGC